MCICIYTYVCVYRLKKICRYEYDYPRYRAAPKEEQVAQ